MMDFEGNCQSLSEVLLWHLSRETEKLRMDGQMDGGTHGRTDGRMDGWMFLFLCATDIPPTPGSISLLQRNLTIQMDHIFTTHTL
jgi:hypothetical protein